MPLGNDSAVAFLIPRCFRRKKTPPTPDTVGNIFEARMKQRMKKQNKRSNRARRTRPPPDDDIFATLDLLAARDQSTAKKYADRIGKKPWPQMLSWDSAAETFVSPPSSVGAEAGGVIGTTHTTTPPDIDPENSDGYTPQLTRQKVSQEALFRLQQLAHLDVSNSVPSFVYQVPRQSARKWSEATTKGSAGEYALLHSSTYNR
ncbi:uncharacterized protein KRP23_13855 [Phytophthora ramorum]|uniref:uncharacterized protein n=1 Tax=Phytophthora ramorum TaxID=164328 RepID=UPI00309FF6E4|nr:hypothetical protein KRP23_13855 [Phytophthora ramorum]